MKKALSICLLFFTYTMLFSQDNWFMAQTEEIQIEWISASSELVEAQYQGAYIYPPVNMLDGDFSTTWSEASEGDSGIGEEITIQFREPVSFDEIQIVNGFAHGNDYYNKNNRLARFTLTQVADQHFQVKSYTLQDGVETWQSIAFELDQTAQTVIISIDEVYRGYRYDDTCINDIRFLYQGRVIPYGNVDEIRIIQEEHSRKLLEHSSADFLELFEGLFQGHDYLYLRQPDAMDGVNHRGLRISLDRYYMEEVFFQGSRGDYYYEYGEEDYSYRYYELLDFRLVEYRSIDYVETQRTFILKLDGTEGLYINGVYYEILPYEWVSRGHW